MQSAERAKSLHHYPLEVDYAGRCQGTERHYGLCFLRKLH